MKSTLFLVWVLVLQMHSSINATAVSSYLGESYFLHEKDLKAPFDWIGTGASIFALEKDDECIVYSNAGSSTSEWEFYAEQSDFASSLGFTTDSSVSASIGLFTASASISTAWSSSTTSSSKLSSSSLRSSSIVAHFAMDSDCYPVESKFDPDFLEAFQALPTTLTYGATGFIPVPTATHDEAWADYASFIDQWGSHVVTGVHTGAFVEILTTATSESETEEESFQLNACLSASFSGVGAEFCAGYSESETSSESSSNFQSTMTSYGGDTKLGSAVGMGKDSDALQVFLDSGSETTPAYYTYTPTWDVLQPLYTNDSDSLKRLKILEAYYNQFLVEVLTEEVEDCTIVGAAYYGNQLSSFASDSVDECGSSCSESSTCALYTYNENEEKCYMHPAGTDIHLKSTCVVGPKSCGTKTEAGYEILVTENAEDISFSVRPCEFPIALEQDCTACGNTWLSYTADDRASCSWWSCSQLTLEYCSSPEMKTFPDDWTDRLTSTSHYSNPVDGCLADETQYETNGGWVCAPECELDGTCTEDVPDGVTATPTCTSIDYDGDGSFVNLCMLSCDPDSDECGLGFCVQTDDSNAYCLSSQS